MYLYVYELQSSPKAEKIKTISVADDFYFSKI